MFAPKHILLILKLHWSNDSKEHIQRICFDAERIKNILNCHLNYQYNWSYDSGDDLSEVANLIFKGRKEIYLTSAMNLLIFPGEF